MSLWTKIFKKRQQPEPSKTELLTGLTPTFTPFSGNAYANDIYRAAVDAIARNTAKLKGVHVIRTPTGRNEGNSNLNRLLQTRPNQYISAFDILYRMITHYYLYNNSFAWLDKDERGNVSAIYPLKPSNVEFMTDPMNYIKEYFEAMRQGNVIVSKRVYKQYEKLVNNIDNPDKYIFDESKALKPIKFIENFCKHSKGEWAGKPVILELFQKAFISALFGFVDSETGYRKYRETLFFCGRKNGKSTVLSGLALFMLMADGESGSECYSIATKKDQAKIVFDEALNMVRQSPDLSRHIRKRKTDLYFALTMSKFQALGKNSDTLDGLNSHLIIVDELHGIKDRNLYEVMKQSLSTRRQPLFIMITTAGTVRECIFDDIYSYACNIVDGNFTDETFLPILYELDNRRNGRDCYVYVMGTVLIMAM